MISILYDKSTGEIAHRQVLNRMHSTDEIHVTISEIADQFDKLNLAEIQFDPDVKPETHRVTIDDGNIRVVPKPEVGGAPPLLRDIALKSFRKRNRSNVAAMHGMRRVVDVFPEARRGTSFRVGKKKWDFSDLRTWGNGNFAKPHEAPEISVVVPVWNMEKYIGQTIKSILAQEVERGFELILVDNGSDDKGRDIMIDAIMDDSRCRVVRLEHNLGQACARNIGVMVARGAFVNCFDGDDGMMPGMLQRLRDAFDERTDVVHGHLARYDSELTHHLGESHWLERDIGPDAIHYKCAALPSQCLIRRSAFVEKGAWYWEELNWCEDVEWIFWAYYRCGLQFKRLKEVVMKRRCHPGEDSYGHRATAHHTEWTAAIRSMYAPYAKGAA